MVAVVELIMRMTTRTIRITRSSNSNQNKYFSRLNINRKTKRSLQAEIFASLLRFMSNLRLQIGYPLKAPRTFDSPAPEFRSCVKVEVAVLGSPS